MYRRSVHKVCSPNMMSSGWLMGGAIAIQKYTYTIHIHDLEEKTSSNHLVATPTCNSLSFLRAFASAIGDALSSTRSAGTASLTAMLRECAIKTLTSRIARARGEKEGGGNHRITHGCSPYDHRPSNVDIAGTAHVGFSPIGKHCVRRGVCLLHTLRGGEGRGGLAARLTAEGSAWWFFDSSNFHAGNRQGYCIKPDVSALLFGFYIIPGRRCGRFGVVRIIPRRRRRLERP